MIIHRKAVKEGKQLPKEVRKRLYEFIKDLQNWPNVERKWDIKKLSGKGDGYRFRFGVYRVIFFVNEQKKVISVVKVGHRKNVYR